MKAIELDKGLFVYQFDPAPGDIEGLNFMAIIEDGRALFLDTGYRENMTLALEDLARRGAVPAGAIISHYHPDHDGGLALLGKVEIRASLSWKATASQWQGPGGPAPVEPTILVGEVTEMRFGRRRLAIQPLPGHSQDSLAVTIDGRWLYAADAILLTNDGRPLLPSVHARPVSLHLEAIDWLAGHSDLVFIPGHGSVMQDQGGRERDLANRRRYLAAIAATTGPIGFEEATAGCEPPFIGREWHEENYR
jgi:glyoxylase-like metal-dependent hydrolase (beta-lactamase superfamily II)